MTPPTEANTHASPMRDTVRSGQRRVARRSAAIEGVDAVDPTAVASGARDNRIAAAHAAIAAATAISTSLGSGYLPWRKSFSASVAEAAKAAVRPEIHSATDPRSPAKIQAAMPMGAYTATC